MKTLLTLALLATSVVLGQQGPDIPSVSDLIARSDKNGDGKISKEEASGAGRLERQFPRWDADQDGFATRGEIIAMRRKFGIDTEGNRLGRNGGPRDDAPAKLTIPAIDEITRTDGTTRPSPKDRRFSLAIVKTEPHAVSDNGYVILTDHSDEAWLKPLRNLATHHNAKLLRTPDLATLHANDRKWAKTHARLKRLEPRFVAIAPRPETYREKMLAGMWKLLSTLDDDPELDVFPGLLVAPDAESFGNLIAQSIWHKPQSADAFRLLAQCHFTDPAAGGIKSLQKVGILRRHFTKLGCETASLVVASRKVRGVQPLEGEDIIYAVPDTRLLQAFPDRAKDALAQSSLLVMFGHGSPGMSCGLNVDAFHELDLGNKVVMAGSCWSAAPETLDFPMPRRDAAGTDLEDKKERFLMRAVKNGAVVSFGHMRLNQGFPTLYPVLEAWTEGKTVGEGYQRLINAILREERTSLAEILTLDPASLNPPGPQRRSPAIPGNRLLYVIIGDPALQPFEKLPKTP